MNYTKPALREKLKKQLLASNKGGKSGQWSARKSQMLAVLYEKAGGGYTGKKSKAAKSLDTWTKQKWRTKSGKPSLKTGERYFPEKVIKSMDSDQYAYETRKKRASLKKGEQFADWSEKTVKRYRKTKFK